MTEAVPPRQHGQVLWAPPAHEAGKKLEVPVKRILIGSHLREDGRSRLIAGPQASPSDPAWYSSATDASELVSDNGRWSSVLSAREEDASDLRPQRHRAPAGARGGRRA